jgi:hypothetical protein
VLLPDEPAPLAVGFDVLLLALVPPMAALVEPPEPPLRTLVLLTAAGAPPLLLCAAASIAGLSSELQAPRATSEAAISVADVRAMETTVDAPP